jgi:DNA primase catalytic core
MGVGLTEETQALRQAADIVQIISEYVPLKKRGAEYSGLCPFHSEKTPSFRVNREKGVYRCDGCGVGGDVFTFVGRVENVTFAQAKAIIAEKAGVTLSNGELTPEQRQAFAKRRAAEEQRGRRAHQEIAITREARDLALTQYYRSMRFLIDHDMDDCARRGDLRYGFAATCYEQAGEEVERMQAQMDELAKVARLVQPEPDEDAIAVTVQVIRLLEIAQFGEAA